MDRGGRYAFTLRYVRGSGQFAFGALSQDESRWLAVASTKRPSGDHFEMSFELSLNEGQEIHLMLANNMGRQESSSMVLRGLSAALLSRVR